MSIDIMIFQVVVLIMSAVIHEYFHGWAAYMLGDHTAEEAGRLTINPIKHLDFFGSFLLPMMLFLSGVNFILGYAKPVPYNPYNLSDQKYGPAKVAAAGPLANLIMALMFGLLLRFALQNQEMAIFSEKIIELMQIVVYINLLLMVFNLIPIPPMDGSKILSAFLPYRWQMAMARIEPYGMILVFAFVFLGFSLVIYPVMFLYSIIVGF